MSRLLHTPLLRSQSDRRLAALARDGHEPAFTALVERHHRALLRYARRVVGDARAEDVVQQTFVNAWTALSRDGEEIRDVRAWLYRIVHNASLKALAAKGNDHLELGDIETEGPQVIVERQAAIHETLSGVARLPARQREALVRTAIAGHSQHEVAEALGVSEGTVRQLVFRARTTLRAAGTAITPAPLARWAAAHRSSDETVAERISELVTGAGAGAGLAATITKTVAVVAVVGGIGTGAVGPGVPLGADERSPDDARTARPPGPDKVDASAVVAAAEALRAADGPTSSAPTRRRADVAAGRARDPRHGGYAEGRDELPRLEYGASETAVPASTPSPSGEADRRSRTAAAPAGAPAAASPGPAAEPASPGETMAEGKVAVDGPGPLDAVAGVEVEASGLPVGLPEAPRVEVRLPKVKPIGALLGLGG